MIIDTRIPMGGSDYENWGHTNSFNINLGGGAPMVKIKDFTLASKKSGGHVPPPPVPYTPPAHANQ